MVLNPVYHVFHLHKFSVCYGKSEETRDLKSLFIEQMQTFKEDLRAEFVSTSETLIKNSLNKSVSTSVEFKRVGNKRQFDFKTSVYSNLEKAQRLVGAGDQLGSLQQLDSALCTLKKQNKLIRLADKSPAGWGLVAEYKSDEPASDSADDNRIRRAETGALAKKR